MGLSASPDDRAGALARVAGHYAETLARHGMVSRGVGWKDEASQALRFEKLREILPPEGRVTVNDWGCGYGALFRHLEARLGPRLVRYAGYDLLPEMIAAARAHVPDPRAEFFRSDRVEAEADFTFVSGTFNVRPGTDDAVWEAYVKEALRGLWAKSRRGLVFNLLTDAVDWRAPELFYADPAAFLTFCRRELSRHVRLIHDYPLYEWTLLVRREAAA